MVGLVDVKPRQSTLKGMTARIFVQMPGQCEQIGEQSEEDGGEGDNSLTPGARKHQLIRDSSIKIIKNYNNLDLDVYDKHITDF